MGIFRFIAIGNWNSGFIDNVVSRIPNNEQVPGLPMCGDGVTTNQVTCGSIDSAWPSEIWSGNLLHPYIGNLACATFSGAPGDSGGPVYYLVPGNEGEAAGVIDVETFLSYGTSVCYTTIDSVLQGISNTLSGHPNAYVVGVNGSRY